MVRRMGPVKTNTLRFYMTRSFEEMTIALKELEEEGKISKVTALVPEPRISIVLLMKWNYFKHLGEKIVLLGY